RHAIHTPASLAHVARAVGDRRGSSSPPQYEVLLCTARGIQATWRDRVRTTRGAPGTGRSLFPRHPAALSLWIRRAAKGDRSTPGIRRRGLPVHTLASR